MNNQIKQNNGRKASGIMKVGTIIAIILSSILLFLGLVFSIIALIATSKIPDLTTDQTPENAIGYSFALFILIASLSVHILSIILNSLLLKGKLNSNIAPGILALSSLGITFIGITVGVLILIGKFEDQINPDKDNDFISKNVSLPKFSKKIDNKEKTALTEASKNGHTEIVKELLNYKVNQ